MIRLNEIKDIVAKENGYKSWNRCVLHITVEKLIEMYDDVSARYAREVAERAVENVIDGGYTGTEGYDDYIVML